MAQDQKQSAIIEAAIRRFAHFGVAKTTMAEIAGDLAFSKASLYYYFPDKLSLYAQVLKSITEQGAGAIDDAIANEADPFRAIHLFLEQRTDFIIRYHNILEYLKTFTPATVPAELQPVFLQLRSRELTRLARIIEKGVKTKKFKLKEPQKTAALLFDFLEGFRTAFLLNTPNFFPDKKQFGAVLKKEMEFATIFFNGLTIPQT